MGYNIYNFTEEGQRGGEIIIDKTNPALTLSNISQGIGLNVLSTVSTSIQAIGAPVGGNTLAPVTKFISAATAGNVETIGKSVVGSPTVPLVFFGPISSASAPAFEFTAGSPLVSITSVVLTSVSNFVAAIRIKYGSTYGWIPVVQDAGLVGTGAF